jgi:ketosteroid isomerase-like protein
MKKHLTSIVVTLLAFASLCLAQVRQEMKETKPATDKARTAESSSTRKSLEEKITALEKQGNEAVKNKDWNTFSSFLTDDFVLVTDQGIMTGKSEVVSDLKLNLNLRDYSMDDVKVTELAKDAALISYRFRQKGSQKGKDFSSQDYLSAVYVKRGGNGCAPLPSLPR